MSALFVSWLTIVGISIGILRLMTKLDISKSTVLYTLAGLALYWLCFCYLDIKNYSTHELILCLASNSYILAGALIFEKTGYRKIGYKTFLMTLIIWGSWWGSYTVMHFADFTNPMIGITGIVTDLCYILGGAFLLSSGKNNNQ